MYDAPVSRNVRHVSRAVPEAGGAAPSSRLRSPPLPSAPELAACAPGRSSPRAPGLWSRRRVRRRRRRVAEPLDTCAVATPGRRLQSPPPPPPSSAVTSCSCFPVGPVGLTLESAPGCGEGSAGAGWESCAEGGGAEPGRAGRAGDGGGRPGRTPRPDSRRVPGVPVSAGGAESPGRGTGGAAGCGLATCPPRDRLALPLFICLSLSPSRALPGSSGRAAAAPPPPRGRRGFHAA